MWFLVSLCVLALGCALAGRKWGRWFYLRYGRFILPRVLLPAKNRVPTPPLSPALKNDENVEGSLDESGEMHNTDDKIIGLENASESFKENFFCINDHESNARLVGTRLDCAIKSLYLISLAS
uniref:Secreted protein n=1 Tax=Glossina pallidipes TaxID=7398 RepID=A0A1B0A578_GLOPL